MLNHVNIYQGIPPVSKNLVGPDAWVTVLYKKLAPWWPWVSHSEPFYVEIIILSSFVSLFETFSLTQVAEGEIPLKASHGYLIISHFGFHISYLNYDNLFVSCLERRFLVIENLIL